MRFRFITLAVLATLMFSFAEAQQTAKMTAANTGYYEYVPDGYAGNSNSYPLVISLHGIKEKGNTLADVARVANVGLARQVKYGKDYPFILISPQLKTGMGTWPAAYVLEVINHAKKTLRVDPKRVYITGLSLGGFGAWTTLGAYPEVFAAALPICAGGSALSTACKIAAENVPVWGFHGDKDGVVSYTVTTKMINAINACTPKPNPLAKATLFAGMGHYIWDKVYNETNALAWMLSYTNGSLSSSNLPPIVNAGVDVVEYLPTNAAVCNGDASDPDGNVTAYDWTQVSGPSAAVLVNKNTKSLTASSLKAGTYTFRLKAVDDKGASSNDDVKVIISSTTTNTAPVVSAGADRTITLPTNLVDIQGSASDADGIASYSWAKVSGGAATLSGQTTSKLRAANLVAGSYVFRLTAKDTKGAVKSDDVLVTVKSATTANQAPIANAGANKTVHLPTTSVTLYGSAKDNDGSIASYKWTQYGGAYAAIGNSTSAAATITGLKAGSYYFRLTVKDNAGATDYDNVLVSVSSSTASITILNNAESLIASAD